MLKNKKRKGFTLAELLIVAAIIAVLVAVGIPVFNNSVEHAREAHDVATMRQAMSLAVDVYNLGIYDRDSAAAAGLLWNEADEKGTNAYGVYDPEKGVFLPKNSRETGGMSYGRGTKRDGGTKYSVGNSRGSYRANEDYTKAVVMIAIYPLGNNRHIDIYWKTSGGQYVGGQQAANDPKYSIRIQLP